MDNQAHSQDMIDRSEPQIGNANIHLVPPTQQPEIILDAQELLNQQQTYPATY